MKNQRGVISLTHDEQQALRSLEGKFTHIDDLVKGVVGDYHTGLFLHGEGGTGKSYRVLECLQVLKASYIYHNSRMTGRGLFDALHRAPSVIHVIEDAESMMADKLAWGVLRSALWSQSKKKPPEREITWTAFKTSLRFIFTGGIIVISNENLADTIPEIRAIKTRINVTKLDVSSEEILALMLKLCNDGHRYGEDYMSPEECHDVRGFIIAKLNDLKKIPNLRLLMNGLRDYLQWRNGHSTNTWQKLIEGRIAERSITVERRAVKISRESQIAEELSHKPISNKEKIAEWTATTGKGERAYYRALSRAEAAQ